MSRWRRARAGCSSPARLSAAGAIAHLAEPVETSALRGRKRRAKTDRADAKWLRQLLCEGRLPESWLPPEHVRQWRSRARLRNTLVDERTSWTQRIRATLYHHGIAGAPDELRTLAGREFLAGLELPVDARERITVALGDHRPARAQLAEIERDLRALARHQAGCRALMTQYGMGEISALVTLCELGDVTRMHASRQAVRMAGIDIGVHRSDRHAQLGKLTRQGSAPLRWALFEAAQSASHTGSPDYARLSRAQGARALAHPRVPDDRPQTRPPLLPPPPGARPRRARTTRHSRASAPTKPTHHRCAHKHAASSSSDRGTHAPRGGPRKTERPQSLHRNDRSTITSPAANARGRGPR